eukprot:g9242.t1
MDSAASDNTYYENLEDDREVGAGKPKVQETSGRASSSTTFVWKVLGFSVILTTLVCCILYLFVFTRSTGKVLHISDLHYDPLYKSNARNHRGCACNMVEKQNCTASDTVLYGRVGCDAPLTLIESAFESAKVVITNPDFIVFTGDAIRHHSNVIKGALPDKLISLFRTISNVLTSYFGSTVVIAQAFGNDDFQKNYFFNISKKCDQPLLREVLPVFQRGMPNLAKVDTNMFTCGGFYSVSISSKLTIIVLNTVLYSVRHNPKMSNAGQVEDPMGQFAWFDETLGKLQQDNVFVWIVGHIAPGYESFAMEPMWPNVYTRKYVSIVTKYARIVKAQFFGHEHLNTYRLFESGSNVPSPIIISGSISPIFCNAPSYRVIEYDKSTYDILDFVSYGSDVGEDNWSLRYRFSSEFDIYNGLSNTEMRKLTDRMRSDEALLKKYRMRKGDNDKMPYPQCGTKDDPADKNTEICAIEHLEQDAFEECVRNRI